MALATIKRLEVFTVDVFVLCFHVEYKALQNMEINWRAWYDSQTK
jgi:hypothetical protein